MATIRAIGLMSGTSLDGVDAALVETDGENLVSLGPALTRPYDPALRRDLRSLLDQAPQLRGTEPFLLEITQRLTEAHADAISALDVAADMVGFHGQTVLHRPAERRTWQIGDASLLAKLTGLPVAHDFRSADISGGGEGAPLAPVFHAALAHALPRPLAVLNLGGVANVTYIGAEGTLLAGDTGPGNALLDDWAFSHTGLPCDRDGNLARAGRADEAVLERLLAHPYFARPLPKSLDRLDFSVTLATSGLQALSAENGAATLVAFTAEAVRRTALPGPPLRWLVCGGGRHNPVLMAALQTRLEAPVDAVERVGWDGDAVEAQCFGYLAVRVSRKLPLSFPGTTGVARPLPGGRLVQPP